MNSLPRHFFTLVLLAAGMISPAVVSQVMGAIIQVPAGSNLSDVMATAVSGDVLILACGTYQDEGVVVTPGVTVRSASGQAGCVILETLGTQSFFIVEDAGADTRFEGLIFGWTDGAVVSLLHRGGGVYCTASSPVFQRCEFRDLSAAYGGAMFLDAGSSPEILDCRFLNNNAWAIGGAIACMNESSPTLAGCLLIGNEAGATGGAINAAAGSLPSLTSCTLVGNGGATGSGLAGWDQAVYTLDKCIVADGLVSSGWEGDFYSVPAIACSDLYGNAGGDWVGALADQVGLNGNLSVDPEFCSPGEYTLNGESPCAPPQSSCGLIGALPVDCWWIVGVENELPLVTQFGGNYPNPFNPKTIIQFDVGRAGQVSLAVYDVAGRLVRQLLNEPMPRGSHEVTWAGQDDGSRAVAAGVYFLRLESFETVATQRVTLIK